MGDGDVFREYLNFIALKCIKEHEEYMESINSLTEWEAFRKRLRYIYQQSLGEFPIRNPLKPHIIGEIIKPKYSIQKVIFQSQPDLLVTANLYLPKKGKLPAPGIVVPCGHSNDGKVAEHYQKFCISLVLKGYVVLIYDPISQGERVQYRSNEALEITRGYCTYEHCLLGNQYLLLGANIALHMIWDSIRAIDYLSSRPEVDSNRIGISGCSGGGTNTAYTAILDPRIKAAAPICYITSRRRLIETIGAQDAEQNLVSSISEGLDHYALCALAAPMPYLIGAAKEDEFPIDGTRRSYELAKKIYSLYGADEQIDLLEVEGGHGISEDMIRGVGNWFDKWLMKEPLYAESNDEPIELEPCENLLCTPNGDVHEIGSKKIITLLQEQSKDKISRIEQRRVESGEPYLYKVKEFLKKSVVWKGEPANKSNVIGSILDVNKSLNGLRKEKLHINTEEGFELSAYLFSKYDSGNEEQPVIIDVCSSDTNQQFDLLTINSFVEKGFKVFSMKPRGTGKISINKNTSRYPISTTEIYGDLAIASYDAFMLGNSLFGMRVYDILRVIDYLVDRTDVDKDNIVCIGQGSAGLWSLFAAAIDERIIGAAAVNFLSSYALLASNELYKYKVDDFIPNILNNADVSDIAALIAPRPLLLVNPLDHMKGAIDEENLKGVFSFATRAYAKSGNVKGIKIYNTDKSRLPKVLIDWLDDLYKYRYQTLGVKYNTL